MASYMLLLYRNHGQFDRLTPDEMGRLVPTTPPGRTRCAPRDAMSAATG